MSIRNGGMLEWDTIYKIGKKNEWNIWIYPLGFLELDISTCKIFHILNFLISLKKVVFELFCEKFVHVFLVSFYVVKTKNAGSRNIFWQIILWIFEYKALKVINCLSMF